MRVMFVCLVTRSNIMRLLLLGKYREGFTLFICRVTTRYATHQPIARKLLDTDRPRRLTFH